MPTRRALKEERAFYLFASPWIVGFLVFLAGPMIASILISFTEWDSFTAPDWVGLDNYRALVVDDEFWLALRHTAVYAVCSVPLNLGVGLWLANLLNKRVRMRKAFRTLIYLPVLVPLVATALLFKRVLAPSGPLNDLLGLLGIQGPGWLVEPSWAIPALIVLGLWGSGSATVLLLAGMKGIPTEFYEAAEIDGAGAVRQFWSITVPQVTPIILFNLVMGMIGAFQIFSQAYVLSQGANAAPANSMLMLVQLLFNNAFGYYRMGYASAVSWVLFLIVVALTLLTFRSSRRWVFYETEVR